MQKPTNSIRSGITLWSLVNALSSYVWQNPEFFHQRKIAVCRYQSIAQNSGSQEIKNMLWKVQCVRDHLYRKYVLEYRILLYEIFSRLNDVIICYY